VHEQILRLTLAIIGEATASGKSRGVNGRLGASPRKHSNRSSARSRPEEWDTQAPLGDCVLDEASIGPNRPGGAWVYPIPRDASEQTIDWNAFLGDAPKRR